MYVPKNIGVSRLLQQRGNRISRLPDAWFENPWTFHFALSAICLIFLGVPLLFMQTEHINPDTYYYISIANFYLYESSPWLRDAFTVGPVIPLLLAFAKSFLSLFISWGGEADIYLVKSLALLCHLVILNGAGVILRRDASGQAAFVFLTLFTALGQLDPDFLSLNGELVSIAFLTLLMIALPHAAKKAWLLGVCVLTVLVVYTKLQSILILGLLLLSELRRREGFWKNLAIVIAVVLLAEAALFISGIGLIRNAMQMLHYVNLGTPITSETAGATAINGLSFLYKYAGHLRWALIEIARILPVFIFVLFCLFLSGRRHSDNVWSDWRLWLIVSLITILTPGRAFSHYVLYAIVFLIRFSGPVLADMAPLARAPNGNRFFVTVCLILLVSRIMVSIPNIGDPYSEGIKVPKFSISSDVDKVASLLEKDPGTVLIHGWDYRFYSFLNAGSYGLELPLLSIQVIDEVDYLNGILSRDYKYIIDVVRYSGIIRDPFMAISESNLWGMVLRHSYEPFFDMNGLRVYKRKLNEPMQLPFRKPRPVSASIVEANIGCAGCFPKALHLKKPFDEAWASYDQDGDASVGDFVISFAPITDIASIRYMVGPSTEGLGLKIVQHCKDGRLAKQDVNTSGAKAHQINVAYVDNSECQAKSIRVEFSDMGRGYGQWIGFLGSYSY